jgi:hypothetical protein
MRELHYCLRSNDNTNPLLGDVRLCAPIDTPELSTLVAEQLFLDYPEASQDKYGLSLIWTTVH